MIKVRVRDPYEMIEEWTKENGGEPPIIDGLNIPLTKENWDKLQELAKKHYDAYAERKKMKKGFN